MIRAVVFDFDGVIANSEPLHFRAFREIAAGRGFELTERDYYERYLGFDDIGAFAAMAGDAGKSLSEDDIAAMVAEKALRLEALERDGSVLFDGAREAIVRMAAFGPIAIASGAIRPEIERVLERERLRSYFPVLVSAEDTPLSKPDPAPYALAVSQLARLSGLDLHPGECVAVEDSKWGLQSAKAAGLHTIAITHSYPGDQLSEADFIITHLDDLTAELFGLIRRS